MRGDGSSAAAHVAARSTTMKNRVHTHTNKNKWQHTHAPRAWNAHRVLQHTYKQQGVNAYGGGTGRCVVGSHSCCFRCTPDGQPKVPVPIVGCKQRQCRRRTQRRQPLRFSPTARQCVADLLACLHALVVAFVLGLCGSSSCQKYQRSDLGAVTTIRHGRRARRC